VNVAGATAPYIFAWTDVTGNPIGTENLLVGIGTGTFNMVITDDNECTYPYTFNITDCVGVNEIERTAIHVFPNPSHGVFRVNHNQLKNATLSLFDVSGKMIHSERISSVSTSTSMNLNIPSGVYSLRIISEDMQFQKSVVIE